MSSTGTNKESNILELRSDGEFYPYGPSQPETSQPVTSAASQVTRDNAPFEPGQGGDSQCAGLDPASTDLVKDTANFEAKK